MIYLDLETMDKVRTLRYLVMNGKTNYALDDDEREKCKYLAEKMQGHLMRKTVVQFKDKRFLPIILKLAEEGMEDGGETWEWRGLCASIARIVRRLG